MKTIFTSLQTKSLSQQRAIPPGHPIRTPTAHVGLGNVGKMTEPLSYSI